MLEKLHIKFIADHKTCNLIYCNIFIYTQKAVNNKINDPQMNFVAADIPAQLVSAERRHIN